MTNPVLEAKISDIHSWWEVPCIAHFCSLFRASFNLIDFDIEDLEEALLIDDVSDSGNTLIQELIVRLLRGYYGNNSISTFNYQMFLRRLFRQKCREFDCYNPFDNDIDFQFLPMRTKVEILHMLCDFRLDADDVLDILKDLDSDSLRVHPLGYDANKSAYWYFYGTRLYREDYPKKKKEKEKKRGRKRKKDRNKEEESDEEEVEIGSGIWQVVCFTESDWERLALNTEDATDRNEQSLHQIIEEDFLPEIPKLFQEKERLQKKRFSELHPRKSSRIENLKKRKEEEMQYIDKYKRILPTEGSESEPDSEKSSKKIKNDRHERWKNRNNQKEGLVYSDDENSDSESLHESVRSYNTQSGFIISRGRQTNNSLSTITGEIIIHPTQKNRSHEWFDTKLEELHIGMYKVLKKLKEHEDSWPFLEPVDEEDAPNYYKVVHSPMSLQRMEDKLDSGKYKTLAEFKQDFQLILANCKQYNGSRNEYTIMGENLEKVFNNSVNRYIMLSNSSEGEDVTESSDFPEVVGSHKKRKKRRRKRTNSKSTEDADKENERKLSSIDAVSVENETHNADDDISIESRFGEHKPIKRGKGRPPKNASAFDALDIITEQTLRDINKWLDDTPKYTDFSASNSPPTSNSPRSEVAVDIFSTGTNEITNIPKSSVIRPYRQKDPAKKRSIKENHHKHLQMIKQRRRDNPRTIDRLQPGKSKGNLISTITKTSVNKPNLNDELPGPAKIKEPTAKAENTPRPETMLNLGTVLSTDIINLDTNAKKHTFSDNDSIPSEEEDPFSENDDVTGANNELQAENLALDKPCVEIMYTSNEEKKNEDKTAVESNNTKIENCTNVCSDGSKGTGNTDKTDKPTPNLSAWFRAFGAPKAQQTSKRKIESSTFSDNPATPSLNEEMKDDYGATVGHGKSQLKSMPEEDRYDINELPPPTPGRFFMYDEDKDQRTIPSLPSPDVKPMKRQRKLSTGSSVSERSSFSQDPNDPMNSPHPSLDESVYQSPQPYHQSPIHNTGALKVGFYQDMFPKCGSDKSNSCSPREPMNSISPQHPLFSPRDSLTSPRDSICSPRDAVTSPRAEPVASPRDPVSGLHVSSPQNVITSPRYASVSPRDTFSESMRSPVSYSKSPVYTPTANAAKQQNQQLPVTPSPQITPTYKSYNKEYQMMPQGTATAEKSPFSIYPVKKRISAELEQTTRGQYSSVEQQETEKPRTERPSFVPVTSNHEQEHHFTPASSCVPQHILPPNPFSSPEPSSVPISLSHHHHPHSFIDSYPENILLSNPYFRKDVYGSSPTVSGRGQATSHMSPLFMQQTPVETMYSNEKLSQNQARYSPPRQPSPLMSSTYGRSAVPLDFTATTTSPLPLTNKGSDSYSAHYHHPTKYHISQPDGALNYSNKNSNIPQHPFYMQQHSGESERKSENDFQQGKLESPQHYAPTAAPTSHSSSSSSVDMCDPNKYERTGLSAAAAAAAAAAENVYHTNLIDLKQGGYRSNAAAPYSNSPSTDYFNGSKTLPPSGYAVSDLRYPTYSTQNDEKQFYASTTSAPSSNKRHIDVNYLRDGHGRSMEFLSPSVNASSPAVNFSSLSNMASIGTVKHTMTNNMMTANADNGRYDVTYHNRNMPHSNDSTTGSVVSLAAMTTSSATVTTTATVAATSKGSKKSKKKKSATVQNIEISEPPQNVPSSSSMYSHFLGGSQVNASTATAAQELKHNGIIPGSAFNFSSSNTLKNDYQQYFDNLRSSPYFAESGVTEKTAPPQPVSGSSFQFLTQGGTPPFGLAAQAFMNANAPPCSPSIYSSTYLQRPPEELLRPVMLPQGLMSAHSGAYPHGYLNMHDPINRSPWL